MSRRDCVALLVIALAGALLRFLTLDHQSYDHNEAVTVGRVLHASFGATMHVVSDGERSPPLYYVLAWLWSKVFGTGEVGLRALSALIGTLLIPVAYFAARRFGSGRAGVLAAAFVALNPYLIWYSQEARSYGLLVLLSGIGLLFFAKALERGSRRDLLLWSVASALAVCSHYFAVFLIAPQAIWLLYARRRDRRVMAAVAAIVVVGLALLPLALHQEGLGRSNHFTNVPLATRAIEVPTKYFTSEEPGWLIGSRSVDAVQIAALICDSALLGFALWLGLRQGDRRERRGMAVYGVV